MARSKKYPNVKMGTTISNGIVGPQSLGASTFYLSQLIPCRGAKLVLINCRATDATVALSVGGNLFSGASGIGQGTSAGTLGYVLRSNLVAMTGTGMCWAIVAPELFYHDYISPFLQASASGHTAFVCDIEVLYDTDATDVSQSLGQGAALPL